MSREQTRRQLLASVGTAGAVALAGCGGDGGGGGGGTTDWYYTETNQQLSQELVSIVNTKDGKNIQLRRGGSGLDAVKRLNSGTGEFAVVGSDEASFAVRGAGIGGINSPLQQINSVMALYPMPVTIVARPDIEAETLGGMENPTVNIGPQNSRLAANAQQILPKTGANFSMSNLEQGEAVTKVANGTLDAAFAIGDWPIESVAEAAPDVQILGLSQDVRQAVIGATDWFVDAQLPAGVYEGVDYMTPTVGMMALLMSQRTVSSGNVAVITDRILESSTSGDIKTRASYLPTNDNLDLAQLGMPRRLEMHDGARQVIVYN